MRESSGSAGLQEVPGMTGEDSIGSLGSSPALLQHCSVVLRVGKAKFTARLHLFYVRAPCCPYYCHFYPRTRNLQNFSKHYKVSSHVFLVLPASNITSSFHRLWKPADFEKLSPNSCNFWTFWKRELRRYAMTLLKVPEVFSLSTWCMLVSCIKISRIDLSRKQIL